ncbi:hypothetical protein P0W64_07175 [Tsukamurella sp. 8F]|uniref:hypothetical protein n=1 Tax=unclassified Tsukamurella TaxID=2633480 RepID=UPI0023B98CDE|nr:MULTISPECIES: hypothetical protein [unclassified Tsukamurella]MDF0530238.1 hypothetical protein [Tsukamurella sp. 8J]MDF0586555.1 hypothetical protein [Tsukamurella sp. 8F]
MSNQPLPFSNGLPLRRMGAILVLVMAVLIWRWIAVPNTTFRVLCAGAIVFEILFFCGLVFASRKIKNQYATAEAKSARSGESDGDAEGGGRAQAGGRP